MAFSRSLAAARLTDSGATVRSGRHQSEPRRRPHRPIVPYARREVAPHPTGAVAAAGRRASCPKMFSTLSWRSSDWPRPRAKRLPSIPLHVMALRPRITAAPLAELSPMTAGPRSLAPRPTTTPRAKHGAPFAKNLRQKGRFTAGLSHRHPSGDLFYTPPLIIRQWRKFIRQRVAAPPTTPPHPHPRHATRAPKATVSGCTRSRYRRQQDRPRVAPLIDAHFPETRARGRRAGFT